MQSNTRSRSPGLIWLFCGGLVFSGSTVSVAQSTSRESENVNVIGSRITVQFGEFAECMVKRSGKSIPDFPPLLFVLLDPSYVSSMGVDNKKFEMINGELAAIRDKVRTGDIKIDEFRARVTEMERKVGELLSTEQQQECLMAFEATEFYRIGPIEYAKRCGANPEQIAIIQRRLAEYSGQLTGRLRRIEDKRLQQLFDALTPGKRSPLSDITRTVNTARKAAVSPLAASLASLKNDEYRHVESVDFLPKYELVIGPWLKPVELVQRDPVLEKLLSLRLIESKLGMGNVANAGLRRHMELVQQLAVEQKKVDTSEHTPDAIRVREELRQQINDKYQKLLDELLESVDSKFEGEDRIAAGKSQFMSLVSRIGPVVLFSEEARKCLGTAYGAEEFNVLSQAAESVHRDLLKDCLALQREVIEYVFLSGELPVELEANFEWVNLPWRTGVPPVDLLACYASEFGK